MKKFIFLFAVLLTIVSCKKEDIKPTTPTQLPCNQHFVELYSSTGYWDSIQFYHNGVQVLSYFDEVASNGGTPSGDIEHQLTGFYANSGDSVRLTSYKASNGLFHNWIGVDGAVVADSTYWVSPITQSVTLTYVIP